ncbi:MAG: ATP-dependent zinc metalloprotease FtsH [bacterium]|nr:ATP-dependent zinc metalloprotease FtsH [bacterium]
MIQGNIRQAVLNGTKLKGTYIPSYKTGKNFIVQIPAQDPNIYEALRTHIPDYRIQHTNALLSTIVIPVIVSLTILAGVFWFFISAHLFPRRSRRISFSKHRGRLKSTRQTDVTFSDAAGVEDALEELQEIVEFLKDPLQFQKLGGRMPKGVLLVGPPGTGKTLLAKAIAGEANVPFFSISGSDFVEMFAGIGALRVRNMFSKGKRHAPCIIFLDEIDAVGRSRSVYSDGEHGERDQTLNALLVEMDGFNTQEGVILIAATNRPDILDPALLRPGRFDRQVQLDLPDLDGRRDILKTHARKIVLSKNANLDLIARATAGFSGAELANLINEGALLAARLKKTAVETNDLQEACDKVKWGTQRRSRIMNEQDRRIAAYHEAGHALALSLLPETYPFQKISIIPRGQGFLGMTMLMPETDTHAHTRKKIISHITALMAGRAAEEIIFGDISTGAYADIKQATHLTRMMVCEWGMSDKLGPVQLNQSPQQPVSYTVMPPSPNTTFFSSTLALEIDSEIKRIIDSAYTHAKQLLTQNQPILQAIADVLLAKEIVEETEIKKIITQKAKETRNAASV